MCGRAHTHTQYTQHTHSQGRCWPWPLTPPRPRPRRLVRPVPCAPECTVAAHSVVRALYQRFGGDLYAVRRTSDGAVKNIGVVRAGGAVNTTAVGEFCSAPAGGGCTVQTIFDQSPRGNHIVPTGSRLRPVNATAQSFVVHGAAVYGCVFEGGMGYRNDTAEGLAVGDGAESIYMVVSGTHYNDRCCFDYGNAERDIRDDGTGSMEAVYWGNASGGTMNHGGAGTGPWVQADLEKGLWSGNTTHTHEPPLVASFVTAMVKGRAGQWALKGGDAQAGGLRTFYEGVRPSPKTAGTKLPGGGNYNPMKKQGAIILGVGGDNSPS